jgi:GNAT superfamily N-acetyltransferase
MEQPGMFMSESETARTIKAAPEIRRLTESHEMEEIRVLFEEVGYYKPPGYFERCLEEQAQKKRIIFGAFIDGVIAGYCMLNWQPGYHLFRKFGIPEIQDLNVLPASRHKGAGRALIAHCEEEAGKRGHEQMGIGVGLLSDYGAAQRLYSQLGYMPDGGGVTYDRQPVSHGEFRPIDDDLCMMMVKDL